jgi:hypothetical protein
VSFRIVACLESPRARLVWVGSGFKVTEIMLIVSIVLFIFSGLRAVAAAEKKVISTLYHGDEARVQVATAHMLYDIEPNTAVETYWTLNADEIRRDAEELYCPQIHHLLSPLPFDCEFLVTNFQSFLVGVWSQSSVSESFVDPVAADYIQSVREAVYNESHFSIFRKDPRYRLVVETVSSGVAHEYVQIIVEYSPFLFESVDILHRLIEDQLYGGPEVMEVQTYFGRTTISCLKFRYLKHISDFNALLNIFADINEVDRQSPFRVAEIGVGFGGLAQSLFAVVADRPPQFPMSYMFFDIPEVLELTNKYMKKFSWIEEESTVFMNNYMDGSLAHLLNNIDLCISNYAMSELSRNLQDEYIDNVLKSCSMGYLLYNSLGGLFGRSALDFSNTLARLLGLTIKIRTEEVYNFQVQPGELIIMNVDTFDSHATDNKLILWKVKQ